MFEEFTLYLIPLVNPDRVDLVNGVLDNDMYYKQAERIAQSFPQIPFPQGWKAKIQGVDLNLQFPAGWDVAKRNKYAQGYVRPAPRGYVGPTPLSEPESIAMYNFTRRHDFSLILAYHTQDWFIKAYDRPGYTIEAGKGINPLPMSQFDKIYSDNEKILLGGMIEFE